MTTDVVISFDSTGSMSPAIAEVRRKVSSFITTLFASVDDLRIGIINHGDYCDGDRLIDVHGLSTDAESLVKFVQTTKNTGGGDSDEAYEYVLWYARTKLDWRGDNKALIMIGDCDPHALGYRTGRLDIPANRSQSLDLDWKYEAAQCVADGIKIYPIQALNHAGSKNFYKTLAQLSDTPKLDLMQFSDVIQYLTAVVYSQQSVEQVRTYADTLQTEGLFNRNIAAMFNTLLATDEYKVAGYVDRPTTRYTGDRYDRDDKLKEVDPARFQVLHVDRNQDIKSFVNDTGAVFRIGRGFYELTKSETVQERKEVVLRDKRTGDMFSGSVARDMIGLPYGMRGTVKPKYGFEYDVFIQSTSANRKLLGGTRFLYEAK